MLAALYCAGTVVAPWLEHAGIGAGSWLRLGYSPACHQLSDRCLDLGFGRLAVCARCAGLYLGGLLGLTAAAVFGARARPPLRWLLMASAPTLVDFTAAQLGLPGLPNWPRFLIAIGPGVVLGLLLADGITDVASRVGPPTAEERPDPVQ
jgi:uncharacterized membrane protein